jgi:hypothetical protein
MTGYVQNGSHISDSKKGTDFPEQLNGCQFFGKFCAHGISCFATFCMVLVRSHYCNERSELAKGGVYLLLLRTPAKW